jgi:tripartite ATP-independent transporter DctP family solute receptor
VVAYEALRLNSKRCSAKTAKKNLKREELMSKNKWYARPIYLMVVLALVLAAVGVVGCAGGAPTPEKVVMRIGLVTINDPQHYTAGLFEKVVEERTNGGIDVEVYPAMQLGSNDQMLQDVTAGSLQCLLEPTSFLAGFDNVLTVLDLPNFLPDVQTAATMLNGSVGDPLRARIESKGLLCLRFYPYGSNVSICKFDPVDLDAVKGKKIRTMPSQVLMDRMNALGATAIPMGVPELYTALQQGTIDGIEGAEAFIYTQGYYEVAKYLWMVPNEPNIFFFMVNKSWFEGLPKEYQDIMKQVVLDIDSEVHQYAADLAQTSIEEMKKAGVTVVEPSAEVQAELKELWLPIHDEFLAANPEAKPIYDAIIKATK